MARITVTFSISIPPEMAVQIEEIQKKEHRTRSELIREALRRYVAVATNLRMASIEVDTPFSLHLSEEDIK